MRVLRVFIVEMIGFFCSCFIFCEKDRQKFRVKIRYSYAKFLRIYALKIHVKRILSKEICSRNRSVPVNKFKRPMWPRVIYTCITGSYDRIPIHGYCDSRYDYVCFTDNEDWIKLGRVGDWTMLPLQFSELDDVRNSRWHKLHPQVLFPNYVGSVWIDGSLLFLNEVPFLYFDLHFLRGNLIAASRHPEISSIYEEAELVVNYRRENVSVVSNQINEIKLNGFPFPQTFPHFETGVLLRFHGDESIIGLSEEWWGMLLRHSFRDQLSFDYVSWRSRVHVSDLFDAPIEFFRRTAIAHVMHEKGME